MLIETGRKTIIDINGIPRILRECSVNSFLDLKEFYSIYWALVLELDPNMELSFFELIEIDERVKNISLEIIKLVGLKPKWLGVDTLAALIHSYVDTEGNPQRGYIWNHYFERTKESDTKTEESLSLEEYRMFLLAALSETEGGINKALPLLDQLSITELEQYFTQKKRLNDKSNKSVSNAEKFKRLKDKYKEKFGDSQFNGIPPQQAQKWINKVQKKLVKNVSSNLYLLFNMRLKP